MHLKNYNSINETLHLIFKTIFAFTCNHLLYFAKNPCSIINKIISIQNSHNCSMIESPIKRKSLHYPKDFVSTNSKPSSQNKRFTFNEDYQIDASIIKKYSESIEDQKKTHENQSVRVSSVINPQKIAISQYELSQDAPLGQHASNKRPDINAEILKKPRFALKNNEEISENDDHALEESSSPGSIKKQLQSRQTPLPLSDPCRIELVQATNNKITKIPQNYIKYRSSANIDSKTWRSSQKDILEKFQESRMKKSMNQLPTVSKPALNQSFSTAGAKDLYDNFRKRQQSTGNGFGKINAFLMSLKKKEIEEPKNAELPSFAPSAIEKIKEDINQLTRSKKKANADKNEEPQMQDREESSQEEHQDKKVKSRTKKNRHGSHSKHPPSTVPEYLVSYRSSLSYLKDLLTQTSKQQDFRLTVKIPKLFTESLIYKNQEKSQLYQTARTIFSELKIPYENLVIKRYTNCTMMISRNICLIWHFDGKRYLGGWQTQYLDEGCKHGLGLQWQPKNYVYYGEFVKNKKEGLGIYKDRNDVVYVGYWKKGKRFEYADHDSEADDEERQRNSFEEMEDDHDPYDHQDNYYEYL